MSRKAGDVLRDKIEERKGTEWYDKALKVGDLHDPHMSGDGKTKRYSGAEIRAEMRHGRGDMTTEELTKKYEQMYASGKINLNGNAKDFLTEHHGANLARNSKGGNDGGDDGGSTPTPTPTPSSPSTPYTPLYGSGQGGSQSVSNTYGDVDIKGDGNNVDQSTNQTINNSIDYGDSIRNFSYKSGDNGGVYDTPVSMATMAGYYDVDDSAGATAKFLNKYIDANNLAQAGMRADYKARTDFDYKKQADQVNQFNPQAMQERIDREPLINRSRSKVDFAKLFGDVDNGAWAHKWEPTTAPSKIESNVEDIADKYKDDLD
jgi:hypothetical protein